MRSLKYMWRGCRGWRGRWAHYRSSPRVVVGVDLAAPGSRDITVQATFTRDPADQALRIANHYEVFCDRRL